LLDAEAVVVCGLLGLNSSGSVLAGRIEIVSAFRSAVRLHLKELRTSCFVATASCNLEAHIMAREAETDGAYIIGACEG